MPGRVAHENSAVEPEGRTRPTEFAAIPGGHRHRQKSECQQMLQKIIRLRFAIEQHAQSLSLF